MLELLHRCATPQGERGVDALAPPAPRRAGSVGGCRPRRTRIGRGRSSRGRPAARSRGRAVCSTLRCRRPSRSGSRADLKREIATHRAFSLPAASSPQSSSRIRSVVTTRLAWSASRHSNARCLRGPRSTGWPSSTTSIGPSSRNSTPRPPISEPAPITEADNADLTATFQTLPRIGKCLDGGAKALVATFGTCLPPHVESLPSTPPSCSPWPRLERPRPPKRPRW